MFVDEDLNAVHIKSTWRKNRDVQDGSCQTRDIIVKESGDQSTRTSVVEVQTDEQIEEEIMLWNDDSPELIEFLSRVEPLMSRELLQAQRSHAFDGYIANWEPETESVTCLHTLTHGKFNGELQVTGLSWNCTGAVIAASYGRFDHEDWCTHRAALCMWNLRRRNLDVTRPDTVIEVSSCLLSVCCHPVHPGWVAGGTFNGEVLVWDSSREDDTPLWTSGMGDDAHHEPVHKLHWIRDSSTKGSPKYNLVSVAGDGRMYVWKLDLHKSRLKLTDGFILMTESLPREMRPAGNRAEMAVTGLSFLPTDETAFVIGSESGGVFRCSTNSRATPVTRDVACSVSLRSPVTLTFAPHRGPVYSVHVSPHHRNLFMTTSTDKSTRLYSMLQTEPILTLEPGHGYLYSACWSPTRPLVFAVGTDSGNLLLYDLAQSRGSPVMSLGGDKQKKPVYTLRFNQIQTQLLATGDGDGNIQIWQLNDELTQPLAHESDILQQLVNTGTTTSNE